MKTIKIIALCLFILALLYALVIYEHNAYLAAVRPSPNTTLATFFEGQPNPLKVFKFTYQGKEYIYVVGNYAPSSLMNVPSGPPAYIFDDMGKLVDWKPDIAEGKSFAHEWGTNRANLFISPDNSTVISVEEAKRFVMAH
jgi:hypothetical protein